MIRHAAHPSANPQSVDELFRHKYSNRLPANHDTGKHDIQANAKRSAHSGESFHKISQEKVYYRAA